MIALDSWGHVESVLVEDHFSPLVHGQAYPNLVSFLKMIKYIHSICTQFLI